MSALEVRLPPQGCSSYQASHHVNHESRIPLATDSSTSFETSLLRANLQLLQNKVQSLQKENVLLASKNRELEEDKAVLANRVQKNTSGKHLKSHDSVPELKGTTQLSRNSYPHAKSCDPLDTPSLVDSGYSSGPPPMHSSRQLDSQYGDEVAVYSSSLKAPVWKDSSPAIPEGKEGELLYNDQSEHCIADTGPQPGLSQESREGNYGEKCTPSKTAIGGSSMYLNSLRSGRSPSPLPPSSDLDRHAPSRMTLPLNYSTKRSSVEVRRTWSFRDGRKQKWARSSDSSAVSPFIASMLTTVDSPGDGPTAPGGGVELQGTQANVTADVAKSVKSPRRPNRKSFLFCFSRPLTND